MAATAKCESEVNSWLIRDHVDFVNNLKLWTELFSNWTEVQPTHAIDILKNWLKIAVKSPIEYFAAGAWTDDC